MKPQRIQRKRTKGWRMPPDTKYVGGPEIALRDTGIEAIGNALPAGVYRAILRSLDL